MALVPMVLEREGNGERAMDLYSRLLKERIVIVQGPIEPTMANIIKSELLFLEGEDPSSDITMYIDSPGGEVATGMGIYDTMQYIKPDVRTICMGTAASMGSVLLMGGTKGKRYALPHSEIMIHQPSSGVQGKVSDMERSFRQSIRIKEMLHELYSKLTGQPIEKIEQDLDRDTWMTPEEAIRYGLIDEVLTNRH
nr:MAG TPA: Putative ATP dependent Clp protease [Caudoviricetes sp.]